MADDDLTGLLTRDIYAARAMRAGLQRLRRPVPPEMDRIAELDPDDFPVEDPEPDEAAAPTVPTV